MEFLIRGLHKAEFPLLEDFLYEAIFVPPDVKKPPRAILKDDALQVYIRDFGSRPDDRCLVAELDGKVVGAVWTRIMHDYGHIDDETPSLAISLYPEYRNLGIGTMLMRGMLQLLRAKHYRRVSLSVQKANYALHMYQNLGFCTVREDAQECIMVCTL